ncbi:HAD family hydrolase [Streptomyces albidoflavus]
MDDAHSLPPVSLIVTDLDNTLWDWVDSWHASFSAMLCRLSELSDVPQEQLEREIRVVHRRRGTTEYSYLLNELPSLLEINPCREPAEVYDEAIHVLNSERKRRTVLYPGVKEALKELKKRNVPVVAYTESVSYWSEWRVRHTGLDGLIEVMYSSPDHDFPKGVDAQKLRMFPSAQYGLRKTIHRHVPRGILKPNIDVLGSILNNFSVPPERVVYVGDSLMKDVVMAQELGVRDVHAQYGVAQHREEYSLLRRVSHWSREDIRREETLVARPSVTPSHVLTDGFPQMLAMFDFKES